MSSIVDIRISQLLSITCLLTTLVVNPWTNYDPISLPKMVVMSGGSFAIILLIIRNWIIYSQRINRFIRVAFLSFLIGLVVPIFFSGAPLAQQLWGVFGRNTGLLTYLALVGIMFGALVVQSQDSYSKILLYFVGSSVPMTLYCLVQYFHKDPIAWSEKFVFGTLGNVNFLSAYISMTSVALICLAVKQSMAMPIRFLCFSVALIDMLLAVSTKSIQGPVIFAVGISLVPFLAMAGNPNRRNYLFYGYVFTLGIGFVALVLGVLNRGPLAKAIFQPSILFRADYMHAGWAMFTSHPLFGVGMDSYGDWYRQVRGEISTLRTGPGRTSNTAHNIFLDVASNGGFLLALGYLLLIALVATSIWRIVRSGKIRNNFVLAFVVTWIAYEVQALISINQIGVGVWGWVLGGAIVGIDKGLSIDQIANWNSLREVALVRKNKGKSLPASQFLTSMLGFAIGILLASPPWVADVAYRSASGTGNFAKIYGATQKLGSTQQHKELLLDLAMRNNLASETQQVASDLVDRYPRNFFGWRVLSVSASNTSEGRSTALQRARELDPFNPELGR